MKDLDLLNVLKSLTIQNSLFVAKNGNDSTGLRNRLDKPFLTCTAAKNAAQSGDTIYVFAGTYDENDLLSGINATANWYFGEGAIVDSTTGDQTKAIFHTVSTGGGYQGKITGFGIFKKATDASLKGIVFANNNADNFFIEALEMDSKGNTTIGVQDIAGTAKVNALIKNKANSDGDNVFHSNSGILEIRCNEAVNTTGKEVLRTEGANAEIKAIINKVNGSFNCVNGNLEVAFINAINSQTSIFAGTATINGKKAVSDGSFSISSLIINTGGILKYNVNENSVDSATINPTVISHNTSTGKSFITGRLINLRNNAAAHGIEASTSGLILEDVEIIIKGAANSIWAIDSQNVEIYNGVANKAVNANITQKISSLIIDPEVE